MAVVSCRRANGIWPQIARCLIQWKKEVENTSPELGIILLKMTQNAWFYGIINYPYQLAKDKMAKLLFIGEILYQTTFLRSFKVRLMIVFMFVFVYVCLLFIWYTLSLIFLVSCCYVTFASYHIHRPLTVAFQFIYRNAERQIIVKDHIWPKRIWWWNNKNFIPVFARYILHQVHSLGDLSQVRQGIPVIKNVWHAR